MALQAPPPAGLTHVLPAVPPAAVLTLPVLQQEATPALLNAPPGTSMKPMVVGLQRALSDSASAEATAALWHWQVTAQGEQVATLGVVVPGALGLRLGVWVQALPAGAWLRSYGPQGLVGQVSAAQLQAQAERNRQGGAQGQEAETYWSPDSGGEQVTLELTVPPGAERSAVRVAVPQLSQRWRSDAPAQTLTNPSPGHTAKAQRAGSCNLDATCSPEYLAQSRSVVRLEFVEFGSALTCTGTLLNDALSSGTPYVLTAAHCVNRQSVASTLVSDWFYRSSACQAEALSPATRRLTQGATLVYANEDTDVALLRLNEPAPAGVVYAGSYFGTPAALGTPLYTLHHPQGDWQKISLGQLDSYQRCTQGGDVCNLSPSVEQANFLRVRWQRGVVEPGSSGSALFLSVQARPYVVGQLQGGSSSCDSPQGLDDYGRFDVSYRSALYRWLDPR